MAPGAPSRRPSPPGSRWAAISRSRLQTDWTTCTARSAPRRALARVTDRSTTALQLRYHPRYDRPELAGHSASRLHHFDVVQLGRENAGSGIGNRGESETPH